MQGLPQSQPMYPMGNQVNDTMAMQLLTLNNMVNDLYKRVADLENIVRSQSVAPVPEIKAKKSSKKVKSSETSTIEDGGATASKRVPSITVIDKLRYMIETFEEVYNTFYYGNASCIQGNATHCKEINNDTSYVQHVLAIQSGKANPKPAFTSADQITKPIFALKMAHTIWKDLALGKTPLDKEVKDLYAKYVTEGKINEAVVRQYKAVNSEKTKTSGTQNLLPSEDELPVQPGASNNIIHLPSTPNSELSNSLQQRVVTLPQSTLPQSMILPQGQIPQFVTNTTPVTNMALPTGLCASVPPNIVLPTK